MLLFELFALLENRLQFVKNTFGTKLQKKIESDKAVNNDHHD